VSSQEGRRARVEVWQQPDGEWRWRYVAWDGEDRVELPSNEPDSSREEAEQKASVAYPDLPIEVREPPHGDPEEGHGRSGRRRLPRFVVPAVVAAVTVALAVRRPRWWTVAPAAAAVATAVHRIRKR
jgi:hypothetical protein